jgi:murein DD-endopeptidase MepM/ murein hydrolase activator NlpD
MSSAGLLAGLALLFAAPARAQIDLPPLPVPLPPLPLPLGPSPAPSPAAPPQPGPGPASQAPAPQQAQPGPPPKAASGPAPQLPRCGSKRLAPKGKHTPPGNTKGLAEKARPLLDIGLPENRVLEFLAPPFPVAGHAKYSDDWQNPRYTPCFHLHEGTDIFAPKGTPVVAPGPGEVVAFGDHPVGGLSVWLMTDDKVSYFMCHLDSFPEGMTAGQRVNRSTVIGYVGNTGNAEGGAHHLHFEVHPPVLDGNGQPVQFGIDRSPGGLGQTRTPPTNPKPYLDQWLAEAERVADGLVKGVIERGGVLPNDPNSLADLAHSVLASNELGLFGFGRNVNRGIATVALLLGGGALVHTFNVLGKGTRTRRRLKKKLPDTRYQSLYEAQRASQAEAARVARMAADEASLHRRRFRRGTEPVPPI